jgi:hypothetical protein
MVLRLTSAAFAALFALLLAAPAWAGVALKLPVGEDPLPWAPYLALVGFETQSSLPAAGPWVELVAGDDGWQVQVRTANGTLSSRSVGAPVSARDREQIVSVANSLLNPPTWTEPSWADLAVLPPAVEPDVLPNEPAVLVQVATPAPSVAQPPEPAPAAVEPVAVVEPPPEPPTPVAPEPVAPQPPPLVEPLPSNLRTDGVARVGSSPSRFGPWVRGGGGVGLRAGGPPSGLIEVAGGLAVMEHWRMGAGLEITTPSTLDALGGERRFSSVDPSFVVATRIPKVGTMLSLRGGPGWRLFEEQGAIFKVVAVPWFGGELGWDIRLPGPRGPHSPSMIEIAAGGRFDARRIDLTVQGSSTAPIAMPQFSGTISLRLLYQPGRRRTAKTAGEVADGDALAFGQESTRSEVIDPDRTDH